MEDPDIPSCLRPVVSGGWEAFEPHLRDEVLSIVERELYLSQRRGEVDHAQPLISKLKCCSGCRWLRAKLLCTLYPYDRSVWSSVRNPGWWALKLCCCAPYGLQSGTFLIYQFLRC